MSHPRVILAMTPENRISVAALAAAVEATPGLGAESLSVRPWEEIRSNPLRSLASDEMTVLALSFNSAGFLDHRPQLEELPPRSERPGFRVVAGGPHAAARPDQVLAAGADAAVPGEGEVTLPALALAWAGDAALPGGIRLLRDGRVVDTGPAPEPVDLDRWPTHPGSIMLPSAIEISRGCPWSCSFCQTPNLHRRPPRIRHRSPAAVARSVRRLVEIGIRDLRFVCPNALGYGSPDGRRPDPAALESLLSAIRAEAGDRLVYFGVFPGEIRPDFVDPDTVALLRRWTDDRYVAFGAQSGCDQQLRRLRRGHGVEQCLRAAELLRASGLGVVVDVMFGLPGEDRESRRATMKLMNELISMGCRTRSHTFLPLPGTELAQEPPGRIQPEVRRMLVRLEEQGVECGPWQSKAELAPRLEELSKWNPIPS